MSDFTDRIPAPGKVGWRELEVVDSDSAYYLSVGQKFKAKVSFADDPIEMGTPFAKANIATEDEAQKASDDSKILTAKSGKGIMQNIGRSISEYDFNNSEVVWATLSDDRKTVTLEGTDTVGGVYTTHDSGKVRAWKNFKVTVSDLNIYNKVEYEIKDDAGNYIVTTTEIEENGEHLIDISSIDIDTYPLINVIFLLNRDSSGVTTPEVTNYSLIYEGKLDLNDFGTIIRLGGFIYE